MMASSTKGITRYMSFSILMQESWLHGQRLIVVAERQQPAGDGGAETAAQLDTERGAGVHRAVYALVLRQPSVLGAGGDNGIHVALPRP